MKAGYDGFRSDVLFWENRRFYDYFWCALTIPSVVLRYPSLALWFLIDPIEIGRLPVYDLLLLEPKTNLLLRVLHAVRTVADVAANVLYEVSMTEHGLEVVITHNGVVAADGAGSAGERVCSTEES